MLFFLLRNVIRLLDVVQKLHAWDLIHQTRFPENRPTRKGTICQPTEPFLNVLKARVSELGRPGGGEPAGGAYRRNFWRQNHPPPPPPVVLRASRPRLHFLKSITTA